MSKVNVAAQIKRTTKGYTITAPTKAVKRKLDSILEKVGDTTVAHITISEHAPKKKKKK